MALPPRSPSPSASSLASDLSNLCETAPNDNAAFISKDPPPSLIPISQDDASKERTSTKRMPIEMERFGPAFFCLWINVACPYLAYTAGWKPGLLKWTFVAWMVQMTGALGIYHRYFSHRGYKAGRVFTVVLALIGISSGQDGPLGWAVHHRWHHKHCELDDDSHSPVAHGGGFFGRVGAFFWAQGGYLLLSGTPTVDLKKIPDWSKFPEIVFLDKAAPVIYYTLGLAMWKLVSWDFAAYAFALASFLSMNCVQLVNSAAHLFGDSKYRDPRAPTCEAKNIWWLTPIMLGANWHSNHHAHPHCARAGFEWWEIDPMYMIICLWEKLGLVYDLRQPDREVLQNLLIIEK